MTTIEEMKKLLLPDYQERFDSFERIAFELHKMNETDLEMQVIKKMAGLKMMIDHCEKA